MKVTFESRDPQAAALHELAVRRVRFVLRRLTWFIPRIKVKLFGALSHAAGTSGSDRFCHLELKTGRGGIVVIMSRGTDWRSALEAALARARRAMLRIWKHGLTYPVPRLRVLSFKS